MSPMHWMLTVVFSSTNYIYQIQDHKKMFKLLHNCWNSHDFVHVVNLNTKHRFWGLNTHHCTERSINSCSCSALWTTFGVLKCAPKATGLLLRTRSLRASNVPSLTCCTLIGWSFPLFRMAAYTWCRVQSSWSTSCCKTSVLNRHDWIACRLIIISYTPIHLKKSVVRSVRFRLIQFMKRVNKTTVGHRTSQ